MSSCSETFITSKIYTDRSRFLTAKVDYSLTAYCICCEVVAFSLVSTVGVFKVFLCVGYPNQGGLLLWYVL